MANKSSIYTHIRAAHEGVKYPCEECEYQATQKGDLDRHRKSVHEGIKQAGAEQGRAQPG